LTNKKFVTLKRPSNVDAIKLVKNM